MVGPTALSGDHWALQDIVGYQSDEDLSLHTKEMHMAVLDQIGNKVIIWGRNLNSTENKINTLIALFGDNLAIGGGGIPSRDPPECSPMRSSGVYATGAGRYT